MTLFNGIVNSCFRSAPAEMSKPLQAEGLWGNLPAVVTNHIFKLLPWGDRFHASLVCKTWSQAFNAACLWRHATLPLGGRGGYYIVRTVLFLERLGHHLQSATISDSLFNSMDFGVRALTLLVSLRLKHLVVVHDRNPCLSHDPTQPFALVCVVHLLESQHSLQSLTLTDFLLSPADGEGVFHAIRRSSRHLQHMTMLNILQFQRRDGEIVGEHISNRAERCLCSFASLRTLRIDYFLLSNRSLLTMAVNLRETLTDLIVQCSSIAWCQFSFTEDSWAFLRSKCKKLKICLYLEIKSHDTARSCKTLLEAIPHVDAVVLCVEDPREIPWEHIRLFIAKMSLRYAHSLESFHIEGDADLYNLEILSVVQSCRRLRNLTLRSCRCLDLALVFCSWQLQNKTCLKALDCSIRPLDNAPYSEARSQEIEKVVEDYKDCFDRLTVKEEKRVRVVDSWFLGSRNDLTV